MKATLFARLSLIAALLALGAAGWAQSPDGSELPPPPPDGRFAFVHGRPMLEDLKPVTGAPFSAQATTQVIQALADGNQINNKETAMVARDSAGRTRRDSTISRIGLWASAGTPHELVRIVDPVAGTSYMLDVGAKTASKIPFHEHAGMKGMPGHPPSWKSGGDAKSQRTTESLGTQVMAGVNAEGTRTTETIPAGTMGNEKPIVIVSERWYSPDLQETVYSKRSDPRFGTTIYQLNNITRQEPDPSLFQVPADYTVKEGRELRLQTNGAN
jgi:hypothetical protein